MTILVPYEIKTGAENMQIDNDLLESAIKKQIKEPVFRLYGWSPACVSLGRNQSEGFVDKDFLKRYNIDVVRRLTGGRALLHDDEITYSYICPVSYLKNGENVTASYKEISQLLIDKFKMLGISLEFGESKRPSTKFDYCMLVSTGADLCFEGKKLIGSAQCRKEGYILQHGSILYNYNAELLQTIFKEQVDTNALTSIKSINSAINKDDIITLFSEM